MTRYRGKRPSFSTFIRQTKESTMNEIYREICEKLDWSVTSDGDGWKMEA